MQQKYELATRLTYFWHKNEKKVSLNLIFVFEPHVFDTHVLAFYNQNLLHKSQYNLWWGSVASLMFPGSYFQGPGCQDPMSQSRKSQVPGPESQGLGSRVLWCRVSGPDFRLCLCKQPDCYETTILLKNFHTQHAMHTQSYK